MRKASKLMQLLTLAVAIGASPAAAALNIRIQSQDFSLSNSLVTTESRFDNEASTDRFFRYGPVLTSQYRFDGFDPRLGRLQQVTVSILSDQKITGEIRTFASEATSAGVPSVISASSTPGFATKLTLNGNVIDSEPTGSAFDVFCSSLSGKACQNRISYVEPLSSFNAMSDFNPFLRGPFDLALESRVSTQGSILFSIGRTTVVTESKLDWTGSLLVGYVYDDAIAAVPEPEGWALMIAGFGLMGGALRRRHRVVVSGSTIAQ